MQIPEKTSGARSSVGDVSTTMQSAAGEPKDRPGSSALSRHSGHRKRARTAQLLVVLQRRHWPPPLWSTPATPAAAFRIGAASVPMVGRLRHQHRRAPLLRGE